MLEDYQNLSVFPTSSADVLATYQRYAKQSPNAASFANVSSFDAPDPYTL